MHAGSLESTQEARVPLGYASSNSDFYCALRQTSLACVLELWMHAGSLESTQEARVALGYASSNSDFSRALRQTSRVHP